MGVIGQHIKKYRLLKGITQEQLGLLVSVTTQAVSKWECGGTPDAELLPRIAEVLEISIDALFGREDKNFALYMARKVGCMPKEESFQYVFRLLWAMGVGLLDGIENFEELMENFVDCASAELDKADVFAKLMQDNGTATMRMSPDLRYGFLMVEPQASIKDSLADRETLRKVFEIFADDKLLSIIFYMYSRLNTPLTASLIAKNTGLAQEETEKCMAKLCRNNLATCSVIATADGEMRSYLFNQESSVIPMLCFADEIAKKDFTDLVAWFNRAKPLF